MKLKRCPIQKVRILLLFVYQIFMSYLLLTALAFKMANNNNNNNIKKHSCIVLLIILLHFKLGLCAFAPNSEECYLALPASTSKGSALVYKASKPELICQVIYCFLCHTYIDSSRFRSFPIVIFSHTAW